MATQSQSPFTNTRLMLAGVACGIIGAVLAAFHINRVLDEQVGKKVMVYYMKQNLGTDEELQRSHYDEVDVPESYVKAVDKIIWGDGVQRFIGVRPWRRLIRGEPLVTTWFDSRVDEPVGSPPAPGLKALIVPINPKTGLGEGMDIGSIVSVVGKFYFGERGQPDQEERTLRLLERVQVEAINGRIKLDEKTRRRVISITVHLGKETSLRVNAMLDRRVGDMRIEGESEGVRESEANKEIPREVLEIIKEKLGI